MVKIKKILVLIIIFLALLSIGYATTDNKSQKDTQVLNLYYLSVKTNEINFSVNVNDAPIVRSEEKSAGVVTTVPATHWLMPGKNTISIHLDYFDSDDPKKVSPSIEVSLFLHDLKAEYPTPKDTLISYTWPEKDQDTNKLPYVYSENVNIEGSVINTKVWQDAETIKQLADSDKRSIIALVSALEKSLIAGDVGSAITLQNYKINEDALAEGNEVDELKKAAKMSYEWMGKQGPLAANSLTTENAEFLLCCGNKIVLVTNSDSGNAVQLESEELHLQIPVYVSKIANQWTIVR